MFNIWPLEDTLKASSQVPLLLFLHYLVLVPKFVIKFHTFQFPPLIKTSYMITILHRLSIYTSMQHYLLETFETALALQALDTLSDKNKSVYASLLIKMLCLLCLVPLFLL
jgi:hypothetical protein